MAGGEGDAAAKQRWEERCGRRGAGEQRNTRRRALPLSPGHPPPPTPPVRPTRTPIRPQADDAEVTYEAYGPGGTGFIIECLTDNLNRTAGDVKSAITKAGCKVAEPGSVMFNFSKQARATPRRAAAWAGKGGR